MKLKWPWTCSDTCVSTILSTSRNVRQGMYSTLASDAAVRVHGTHYTAEEGGSLIRVQSRYKTAGEKVHGVDMQSVSRPTLVRGCSSVLASGSGCECQAVGIALQHHG